MMGIAKTKNCYSELVEYDINDIDEFPQKWKNAFDIIVCSGMINNNHMDWRIFEEMVLGCSQRGLIIFASRFSYIGEYWYDEVLRLMEAEGRINQLEVEDFFKYDKILASIGRFSKTPSRVFVFEKMQENLQSYYRRDKMGAA